MVKKTSRINRFSRRQSPAVREGLMFRKENSSEHAFFGDTRAVSFFQPAYGFGQAQPVQRKCAECEKEDENVQRSGNNKEEEKLSRQADPQEEETSLQNPEKEQEITFTPTFSERGVVEQNTRHFADCNGVSVSGHTDANYGNSMTAPGSSSPAKDCDECPGEDCVTNTGTVISVFTANPQITLPAVPSGLNECEQKAVQSFINTTLRAHELQHVAAFNTYRGTVKTPYTYRGCAGGLDAHTLQIHEGVESARKIKSDAKSAALDANGANIFNITCKCPDPAPEPDPDNG